MKDGPYVYVCQKCLRTQPAGDINAKSPECCGLTMVLRLPGFVPAAWSPK